MLLLILMERSSSALNRRLDSLVTSDEINPADPPVTSNSSSQAIARRTRCGSAQLSEAKTDLLLPSRYMSMVYAALK